MGVQQKYKYIQKSLKYIQCFRTPHVPPGPSVSESILPPELMIMTPEICINIICKISDPHWPHCTLTFTFHTNY